VRRLWPITPHNPHRPHRFCVLGVLVLFLEPLGRPRARFSAWTSSVGVALALFLEPLGRPRGSFSTRTSSVGVALALFLEPLGRPRARFSAWTSSVGVALALFLEPKGRPRFLGASVGSAPCRSPMPRATHSEKVEVGRVVVVAMLMKVGRVCGSRIRVSSSKVAVAVVWRS